MYIIFNFLTIKSIVSLAKVDCFTTFGHSVLAVVNSANSDTLVRLSTNESVSGPMAVMSGKRQNDENSGVNTGQK